MRALPPTSPHCSRAVHICARSRNTATSSSSMLRNRSTIPDRRTPHHQGDPTMTMSMTERERSLRALRLSGMTTTLQTRALQVAQQQMDFIEAFSYLVQDELD